MNSFNSILEDMKHHGMSVPNNRTYLNIEITKEQFTNYLRHFIGHEPIWNPAYDEIISWLRDNKGKGLFLFGHHGLGKTIIAKYVLPAIILRYSRKPVRYYNMNYVNKNLDEVIQRRWLALDDVGTEGVSVEYGNKRLAFAEVMDLVEKESKLVIVTTNLDANKLKEVYGERTFERVIAATHRVLFTGKSYRK